MIGEIRSGYQFLKQSDIVKFCYHSNLKAKTLKTFSTIIWMRDGEAGFSRGMYSNLTKFFKAERRLKIFITVNIDVLVFAHSFLVYLNTPFLVYLT